jgi:hypothetical protein
VGQGGRRRLAALALVYTGPAPMAPAGLAPARLVPARLDNSAGKQRLLTGALCGTEQHALQSMHREGRGGVLERGRAGRNTAAFSAIPVR